MYYKELIGTQVNQWTVLGKDENSSSKTKMICRCSCGRISSVDGYSLKHGLTKSCGKCSLITDEGDHMRCTLKNGTSFLFDRDGKPHLVNRQRIRANYDAGKDSVFPSPCHGCQ